MVLNILRYRRFDCRSWFRFVIAKSRHDKAINGAKISASVFSRTLGKNQKH